LKSSPYYALSAEVSAAGPGSIVTFGIKGGADAGRKLIDSVQLFSHLATWAIQEPHHFIPRRPPHQQLSDNSRWKRETKTWSISVESRTSKISFGFGAGD